MSVSFLLLALVPLDAERCVPCSWLELPGFNHLPPGEGKRKEGGEEGKGEGRREREEEVLPTVWE